MGVLSKERLDEVARFSKALMEGATLAEASVGRRPKTPGEAVAWWERWGEGEEGRMEGQATRDVAREIQKLIKGYYEDPDVEPMRLNFPPMDARTRHYGVWNPNYGWHSGEHGVFAVQSKAVAEAECDVLKRLGHSLEEDATLAKYRVRCIEEWADEQ